MKCLVTLVTGVIVFLIGMVHSDGVSNLSYVGCFDPGYSLRQSYHHHIVRINLRNCIGLCSNLNTPYAGVEASDNFCYCGEDIAEESVKRNDSLCNVPCPDDSLRMCGGDWLMSLYENKNIVKSTADTGSVKDNVKFLVATSVGVRLYDSAKLDSFDTLMFTSDWAFNVDYHFSKHLVFVVSKKSLFKTTLDPKRNTLEAVPKLTKEVSTCDGFSVDWVQDRIYWANCSKNTSIVSMDLDGGSEKVVLDMPDETGVIKRMEIDPYKGKLFWIDDGVIESCSLSGDNFQTNLSSPGLSVRALALDLGEQRVYYVGTINQSTSLFSMDYDGLDEEEHFSVPQMRSVYGFGVLKGNAYWINYANVRDIIYKAPIKLTDSENVKPLKVVDRAVWHMRLLHPDLQKRPKTDPCKEKGCSHSCVIHSSSLAQCRCPEGVQLDDDGISCIAFLKSERSSVTSPAVIYFVVLAIAALLLISVLLVFLADKYWSHLHSKLIVVPYSRSRGTEENFDTPTYDTSGDNVNLI